MMWLANKVMIKILVYIKKKKKTTSTFKWIKKPSHKKKIIKKNLKEKA